MNQESWICDERVGCVAVYRGPRRNCLEGVSSDPDCVYFRLGQRGFGGAWEISPDDIAMGRKIADLLNEVDSSRVAARFLLAHMPDGDARDESLRRWDWLSDTNRESGKS